VKEHKETVELRKSSLVSIVRCCIHLRVFHENPMDRSKLLSGEVEFNGRHCTGRVVTKDSVTGELIYGPCLCKGYSEKHGITIVQCPECLSEVPMGSGDELIHGSGCTLSNVTFKGHHKWRHAYKSEKECNTPEEYMSQFEVLPEGS
jgi:hypothetical protein